MSAIISENSIPNSSVKNSEQETAAFIRDCAFSPVVAVLTSYDVDVLCEKNNLSFSELLLPFTQLSNETAIKDPNNQNILIKNLRLDFRDLRRDGFLSNAALSLALGELLRHNQPAVFTIDGVTDGATKIADLSYYTGDLNTPWYDSYRRQFLRLLDPPDHEFNRHYLACILVVSTMHDDPLDQLNRLNQAQHTLQHQQQGAAPGVLLPKHAASPKWFSPNTFKYHLLVHDVASGDEKKAESVYQGMKMNYGAHACHLLRINSAPVNTAPASTPDPWAQYLKHRLRHFNSIRIVEDKELSTDIENNCNELNHSNSSTALNGDLVLVGEQTEKSTEGNADGAMIPHPLSCTDLPKLENQTNPVYLEKEERAQSVHHGQFLTSSDIDRIKIFVQEFSVRGLFPYVERQLRLLNEQVAARRGLHKTFMNFTKNLWGKAGVASGSTPNLQSMAMSGSTTFGSSSALPSPEKGSVGAIGQIASAPSITYAYESAEMQTRRLADLASLFQNYDLAYPLYHSLKKEFGAAQAWLHSASAMEFASLCVFLAGPTQSRPYPSYYMEQAINAYLSVIGAPLLASRATIYNTAVLGASQDYGQAAAQYIRLSSGDDLRSALFLEQAACCFFRANLQRKAALHLILAGHRYGKAAKRQHTVRCYKAALKSYDGKGWKFALDHIYLTLGQEAPPPEGKKPLPRPRSQFKDSRATSSEPRLPKVTASSKESTSIPIGDTADSIVKAIPAPVVVQCTLTSQAMVEHDFYSRGLCRVKIGLEIQHTDDVEELQIKTYAGGMSTPGDFQQFYRGYPLLIWATACRRLRLSDDQRPNADGFRQRRLDLTAIVTVPGIYDISALKFSYRRKDSQWEELPLLPSQFLTVIETCRSDYSLNTNPGTEMYYSMT